MTTQVKVKLDTRATRVHKKRRYSAGKKIHQIENDIFEILPVRVKKHVTVHEQRVGKKKVELSLCDNATGKVIYYKGQLLHFYGKSVYVAHERCLHFLHTGQNLPHTTVRGFSVGEPRLSRWQERMLKTLNHKS